MYSAVGNQGAKHDSGYFVGLRDRNSIEYADDKWQLCFVADMGPVVGVFEDDVTDLMNGKHVELSEQDLEILRARIEGACRFLGFRVEWCRNEPEKPPVIHKRID